MKRLKVILPSGTKSEEGFYKAVFAKGAALVDADTDELIDGVRDFTLNVTVGKIITVTAEIIVSEIEIA
jgi:hypothetical protein